MKFLIPVLMLALIACNSNSTSDKDTAKAFSDQNKIRLNWESIPSEFNPQTFEENFQINNFNRIFFDMFGFNNDVEVIYLNSLAQGQGYLKIYTVFKDSGSRGSLNESSDGKSLFLDRNGTYQCSIQIKNGDITKLKGLCFVRLQIFLPAYSEIEIYNVKQLITRRFIPIESYTFISNLKKASFSSEKKEIVEQFLNSYFELNKTPELSSEQLGIVMGNFTWKEEKFDILRKLNTYVLDRQNLKAMIQDKFSFFEREEAERICGL